MPLSFRHPFQCCCRCREHEQRRLVLAELNQQQLLRSGVQRPLLVAVPMWRSSAALLRPLALAAARGCRAGSSVVGRPLSAAASSEVEAAAGAAKRGRGRPKKERGNEQRATAPDAAPTAQGKPRRKPRVAETVAEGAGIEAGDQTVLLVESPAKAKKIQEFLGDQYKVGGRTGWARIWAAAWAARGHRRACRRGHEALRCGHAAPQAPRQRQLPRNSLQPGPAPLCRLLSPL